MEERKDRRIDEDELDFDGDDYVTRYNGEPFTGEGVEAGADGNILTLSAYVEGREEGSQREWYADGTLRSEGHVRDGRAVGEWRQWHPDGKNAETKVFSDQGRLLDHRTWEIGRSEEHTSELQSQ